MFQLLKMTTSQTTSDLLRELDLTRKERDLYKMQRDEARSNLLNAEQHLHGILDSCRRPATPEQPTPTSWMHTDPVGPTTRTEQGTLSEATSIPWEGEPRQAMPSKRSRSVSASSANRPPQGDLSALMNLGEDMGLDSSMLKPDPADKRPGKTLPRRWLDVSIPKTSDLLILSDSVLRHMDPAFHPGTTADIRVFGGMSTLDLVPILFQAGSSAAEKRTIVRHLG